MDWDRLHHELATLRESVDLVALSLQPNLRAVRMFLAERYVTRRVIDDEFTGFAAVLEDLHTNPDPLVDWRSEQREQRTFSAKGLSAFAAAAPSSQISSPAPPFLTHHWPWPAEAESDSTPSGDVDCWFKLMWWLLRSVRCDFEPLLHWSDLPSAVTEDETIGSTMAAAYGGVPSRYVSGHGLIAFKVVPHLQVVSRPLVPPPPEADCDPIPVADYPRKKMAPAPTHSVGWWGGLFADVAPATSSPPELHLYHGSPLPCWHSLLRSGPQPLSRTAHMRHGAAYGEGVYLAAQFSTAWKYSSSGSLLSSPGEAARGLGATLERFTPMLVVATAPGPHLKEHGVSRSAAPPVSWTNVSTGATTSSTAAGGAVRSSASAASIFVCSDAAAMRNSYLLLAPHK